MSQASAFWRAPADGLFRTAATLVPSERARRWLKSRRRRLEERRRERARPPLGWRVLGTMRSLEPTRRSYGVRAGRAIDRHYIEAFLTEHAADIRGAVLEVADRDYTERFGHGVTRSEVLDIEADNPRATIVADLAAGDGIPSSSFDCVILTQTLQYVYDLGAAVRTLHRILRPGGCLLATLPGICQLSRYAAEQWGEYWRFTEQSAFRLLADAFGEEAVTVRAYGNVLASIALLHGFVVDELRTEELDYHDPEYPMLIGARAVRGN